MAVAQTVETPRKGPPPAPPEEPRRGRRTAPPPEQPPDPPEEDADAAPPTPAAERVQFFDRLKRASAADWERYIVYLYRLQPITDLTAGGSQKKFVCKYAQPFDEETVMREHGSGVYRAQLNERAGRSDRVLQQLIFEIENEKYPPRIPKGAWVDDPRNRKWESWYKDTAPGATPAAPGGIAPIGEAFDFVTRLMDRMQQQQPGRDEQSMVTAVLDAVKETRRELATQNDPGKWLSALQAFVPLIIQLLAPKDNGLTAIMQEQAATNRQLLTLLIEGKEKRSNGIGELKTTIETLALVKKEFSGGPAKSEWAEMMPQILQTASGFFTRPPGPAPQPAAAAPAAAPTATAEGAPAVTGPPAPYTAEQISEIRQLIMASARPMFTFVTQGRSGAEFAAYFCEGNSLREFHLLRQFGIENLLTMIQEQPAAWNALQPMLAEFRAFMADFYQWRPPAIEPEDDDAPETPPAEAA